MAISVKNYTNRYIIIAILIVMALWALLFYAVLMDEVYDNIDDGLKNQKIEVIREAYKNPQILESSRQFGINQFIIYPAERSSSKLDINQFSKELIYMPYDEEEEPYRILKTGFYSKDNKPYHLELRTSTVEEDDFLINLAISLTVLYVVLVLSILVINHYVLLRAWKPFNDILKNLSQYRFGHKNKFVVIESDVKEFNTLNDEIHHMIARNESVFEGQKRFLENASHELQTPLAITINKMSLLLDDDNLSASQIEKLAEAKQSLHRMVSLNKALLMLSRIENNLYEAKENVNFNNVINALVGDFEDIIDYHGLKISVESTGEFIFYMNKDLAFILLSNLLRNAIKYNKETGEVKVEIQENKIAIANDSQSGALNPDYIYNRFYKGEQDSQSNGLGLSIVQSILNNYPLLRIEYVFEKNMHIFSLRK